MQQNQILFIRVLVGNILFCASDLIWRYIDGNSFFHSGFANFFINLLYYTLSAIVAWCWFVYAENILESKFIKSKKVLLLTFIPVIVLALLTISSYKTQWVFSIDEYNVYHREVLYFLQPLISYIYIFFVAIRAFVLAFYKGNYPNREKYLTLSAFAVPLVIASIIQIIIPGIPVLYIGVALGLLVIYFNFQSDLISLDPLTQLNNRNQFIKYISNKIDRYSDEKELYLMFLDVDGFKSINDRFGHIEGDMALVRVANVLKHICSNRNYFVARYAGDEFVLVCEVYSDLEINLINQGINDTLANVALEDNLPYSLTLSIGWEKYNKENMLTIREFISRADENMYAEKKKKKEPANT